MRKTEKCPAPEYQKMWSTLVRPTLTRSVAMVILSHAAVTPLWVLCVCVCVCASICALVCRECVPSCVFVECSVCVVSFLLVYVCVFNVVCVCVCVCRVSCKRLYSCAGSMLPCQLPMFSTVFVVQKNTISQHAPLSTNRGNYSFCNRRWRKRGRREDMEGRWR